MIEDTEKAQKHIVGLEKALRGVASGAAEAGNYDLANDATEIVAKTYQLHADMGRVAEKYADILFVEPTRRGER